MGVPPVLVHAMTLRSCAAGSTLRHCHGRLTTATGENELGSARWRSPVPPVPDILACGGIRELAIRATLLVAQRDPSVSGTLPSAICLSSLGGTPYLARNALLNSGGRRNPHRAAMALIGRRRRRGSVRSA